MTKLLTEQERQPREILDRIDYFYLQTDGTYKYPNSKEGDLIKMVRQFLVEELHLQKLAHGEDKAPNFKHCLWGAKYSNGAFDCEEPAGFGRGGQWCEKHIPDYEIEQQERNKAGITIEGKEEA